MKNNKEFIKKRDPVIGIPLLLLIVYLHLLLKQAVSILPAFLFLMSDRYHCRKGAAAEQKKEQENIDVVGVAGSGSGSVVGSASDGGSVSCGRSRSGGGRCYSSFSCSLTGSSLTGSSFTRSSLIRSSLFRNQLGRKSGGNIYLFRGRLDFELGSTIRKRIRNGFVRCGSRFGRVGSRSFRAGFRVHRGSGGFIRSRFVRRRRVFRRGAGA